MCGVTLWQWLHIIVPRFIHVEIQYYPRMLFITLISIFNSLLAFIEGLFYASSIHLTQLPEDPVFVIGHPRTGTYTYTCTYTYIHTYIHIYAHTHTHTFHILNVTYYIIHITF